MPAWRSTQVPNLVSSNRGDRGAIASNTFEPSRTGTRTRRGRRPRNLIPSDRRWSEAKKSSFRTVPFPVCRGSSNLNEFRLSFLPESLGVGERCRGGGGRRGSSRRRRWPGPGPWSLQFVALRDTVKQKINIITDNIIGL